MASVALASITLLSGALLATRVEVANWLTVTLNEPLIASAVALAVSTAGGRSTESVVATLAFILERSVSAAPRPEAR